MRGILRFRRTIREMRAANAERKRAACLDEPGKVVPLTGEKACSSPEEVGDREATGSSADPGTRASGLDTRASDAELSGSSVQQESATREQILNEPSIQMAPPPQQSTSTAQSGRAASHGGDTWPATSAPQESSPVRNPARLPPLPLGPRALECLSGGREERSLLAPSDRPIESVQAVPCSREEHLTQSQQFGLPAHSSGQRRERDRLLERELELKVLQAQLEQQRRLLQQQQQLIRHQQELIQERAREKAGTVSEVRKTHAAPAEEVRVCCNGDGTPKQLRETTDRKDSGGLACCLNVVPTSSRCSSSVTPRSRCQCMQVGRLLSLGLQAQLPVALCRLHPLPASSFSPVGMRVRNRARVGCLKPHYL